MSVEECALLQPGPVPLSSRRRKNKNKDGDEEGWNQMAGASADHIIFGCLGWSFPL
jgi:hypothetical protein